MLSRIFGLNAEILWNETRKITKKRFGHKGKILRGRAVKKKMKNPEVKYDPGTL